MPPHPHPLNETMIIYYNVTNNCRLTVVNNNNVKCEREGSDCYNYTLYRVLNACVKECEIASFTACAKFLRALI